jgi:hypothetical protein
MRWHCQSFGDTPVAKMQTSQDTCEPISKTVTAAALCERVGDLSNQPERRAKNRTRLIGPERPERVLMVGVLSGKLAV